VIGHSEHSNESLVYVKSGKLLEYQNTYQILKKDSASILLSKLVNFVPSTYLPQDVTNDTVSEHKKHNSLQSAVPPLYKK
jgi:hypothetical protein